MKRRARRGKWLSAVMILLYLSAGGLYFLTMTDRPSLKGTELSFPLPPSVGKASDIPLPAPAEPAAAPTPPVQNQQEKPSAPPKTEQPPTETAEEELPALRSPVQVTGHRGDSANWPENTLSAIQGALAQGADWVEFDVQASSDGELVVFHDDYLRRVTGAEGRLWDYTGDELAGMDAGAWMNEKFTGTRIPRLSEVLELCRDKIRMNIEIKENAHELKHKITAQVVQMIEEHGVEEQCVVTAYIPDTLKLIKQLNPKIQTALLCDVPGRFFYDLAEADTFSVAAGLLTKEAVENAHAAGKTVTAWLAETEEEVLRLAAMGVDNIMSSDPGKTAGYLYGENGFFTLLAAAQD